MKTQRLLLFVVIVVLLSACVAPPILAPAAPPAAAPAVAALPAAPPVVVLGSVAALAGEFELVQVVFDFAPGAWTPVHEHGGSGLVTVLDGEITTRHDKEEKTFKAGESWAEEPGEVLATGNLGTVNARISALFLLPKGATLTTPHPDTSGQTAPPAPTVLAKTSQAVSEALGEFELVQLVFDFAPGAWTAIHEHGGVELATVLDGEITVRRNQEETTYKAGEGWAEPTGNILTTGNLGSANARLSAAFLLPKGAKLTTPHPVEGQTPPLGPVLVTQVRMAGNSTK